MPGTDKQAYHFQGAHSLIKEVMKNEVMREDYRKVIYHLEVREEGYETNTGQDLKDVL